jgi:hypothetical protein
MKKTNIFIKFFKGKIGLLYFLSILLIFGIFHTTIIVMPSEINIFWFTDIPTLMAVGIMPLSIMYLLYGISNTSNAFSLPLKKDPSKEILNEALWFFKLYNKFVWASSLMVFIIDIVVILSKLGDVPLLASNYNKLLVLAILAPLYAVLINLFIIFPYTVIIRRQLRQPEIKNDAE